MIVCAGVGAGVCPTGIAAASPGDSEDSYQVPRARLEIVLDTFNDERRAYEFMTNPLGVQTDAVNDDVQKKFDPSWDAIWSSAGRLT